MTTTKKAPKRSAPKTKPLKLPEHKTFTIEQLAERWDCKESVIGGCIRDGDLKRTLVTATRPDLLRDWEFYKCDADTRLMEMIPDRSTENYVPVGERLLETIDDYTPLSWFVDPIRCENIIHGSKYEYLYIPGESAIKRDTDNDNIIKVRYFCDLYGNPLIPICDWIPGHEDEYCIYFVDIEKHIYDFPLISSKVVERVENKSKKESDTVKDRQKRIVRIIRYLGENPEHLLDERGKDHIKNKVRVKYVEERLHEKIVERLGYDDIESFPEAKKDSEEYNAIKENLEGKPPYSDQQRENFRKAWAKLFRENKETGYYDLKVDIKALEDTEDIK